MLKINFVKFVKFVKFTKFSYSWAKFFIKVI